MRSAYVFLFGEPEGKGPFVEPKPEGEGDIKLILKKWGLRLSSGLIWPRKVTSGGLL
jgi:hypothetical protein